MRLILAGLHEPVGVRRAWAKDLEDDDGSINDGLAAGQRRADDDAIGVAGVVLFGLDLEIAAEELTRLTAEARSKGESEIPLDLCVPDAAAGHRHGADAIEFVAQGLPFLPLEEFGERHGFA